RTGILTMKKRNWIISTAGLVFLLFLAWQFCSMPSIEKVAGGFEQTASIRNENNLGTIQSYYAFSTSTPQQADYTALVNLIPHNKKGGITTVFFFEKGAAPPTVSLPPPHFDTAKYTPLAIYRRDRHHDPI